MYYRRDTPCFTWWPAYGRLAMVAAYALVLAALAAVLGYIIELEAPSLYPLHVAPLGHGVTSCAVALAAASLVMFAAAVVWRLAEPPRDVLRRQVRRAIADPRNGNPLSLKEGQRVPVVSCAEVERGRYSVRLTAGGTTPERLEATTSAISACLSGRYSRYIVAATSADEAGSFVDLIVEDTALDWAIRAETVADLCATSPYMISIDQRTAIDLRTSQSILVAGRTRSGKTYGIIAMLLQVLARGADEHGSRVVIIDPKGAELSRLPGVVSPSVDGDMSPIIEAMRSFDELRRQRQAFLNELSEERGEAVRWWDAGMNVSLLFIDEYVSCRAMLADKKQRDEFDGLLRIAATMGASAGCYCVLCVAQASVGDAGLSSMVRNACTTRVLFRPTPDDARLMWPEGMGSLPSRDYGLGAALFTTTDGVHERPTPVQFPAMAFPEMAELRRLMADYGQGGGHAMAPAPNPK